ncbi:MAG: alpha,6-mannosyltransferase [Solirubrobacteraceae bacterium]|jgi:alpha-1,6-mannosyltransferase|nr:alpha,6-mannosyltransferase [Solirubrobacteraceae bacterium]
MTPDSTSIQPAERNPRALSGEEIALLGRQAVGALSLAGLALCSWVIVTGAAYRPTRLVPARQGGFPDWLRGPLGDLGGLLPYRDFAGWMVAMLVLWLVALLTVPALRARWAFGFVAALHLLFFLGPPLISADVFGYIDWARMGALHDLNPYATNSGAVVTDAVYRYVGWDNFTSPYGPLFTLFTYALVPLGVPGTLWALKLAVLASSLGCVALAWACARELGRDGRLGLVLYGLNPAVLVYAVGGAHNDVLMMLGVLAGVWLVLHRREQAGAVAVSLAVAIKASAGLMVPFLILGARRRLATLVAALATGAVVLAVALAVFGSHALDFVNVLGTQQGLDSGTSVIAQLGAVLGWTGNPTGARTVASVLFVAAVLGLVWRTWRDPETWLDSAAWATVALLVCTSWFLAWYIVWLAPLAALGRSRWLVVAAAGLTAFVILARMVPYL